MKLLFCTKTGCSPYHWPLFLGYPWLETFLQFFPSPPPQEGGKKTCLRHCTSEDMNRNKKKGRGQKGLLLGSGNQVGFSLGNVALRSGCCRALLSTLRVKIVGVLYVLLNLSYGLHRFLDGKCKFLKCVVDRLALFQSHFKGETQI